MIIILSAESQPQMLNLVLQFTTGAREVPPLGLNPRPSLMFRHPEDLEPDDCSREYPVANTCANILRLPILAQYDKFKARMEEALAVDVFTME